MLINFSKTYRLWNDKSGEDVPYAVKCRWDYGGDVVVRRYGHCHHPIQSEIQQGEVCEENVPEELNHGPLEPDHSIHYDAVYKRLS